MTQTRCAQGRLHLSHTVAFAALLCPASASLATDEGTNAVETIVVTEEPTTDAERRAPSAFSTTIDLEQRHAPIETVAEILGETVGVQVQRFGGLGAFSTISIRGSSANQVPVYLDGIPLSQARDQTVNLSDLPLDGLAEIETYRGTVPIGFGGGGIGGVVNLVTRPATDEPQTQFVVGYGSFDTRKAVATHTRSFGDTDLLAHISYLGSEGDFEFFDDNGTPENPLDDERTERINNDLNSADLLIKLGHRLDPDTSVELLQELFFKDQGVPGPGSTQFEEPSLLNLRSLTYLRLRRDDMADGAVDGRLTLYGSYNLQAFDSPQGDFGAAQDTRNQTMLLGASSDGSWLAPCDQTISWFAEAAFERFFPYNETNPAPLPKNGPEQSRTRLTLSVQDEIRLFDDLIATVPSLRFDQLWDDFGNANITNIPTGPTSDRDESLWSPAIGVAVRPADWITVRGNIGRFQRPANFSELFSNTGSVVGNAALRPETAINRDIGFVVDGSPHPWIDSARFEYAFFYNNVSDLIAFEQVNPRRFRAANVGDTRVTGHELSLTISAVRWFGLDLNYTYQDSENRSVDSPEGNQLPLRPRDEVFVRPRLDHPWGTLYYEFTYLGDNPTDRDNFLVVDARPIHSLGATVQIFDQLTLRLRAANITDADIRDLGDFPLPGVSIFGSLEVVL